MIRYLLDTDVVSQPSKRRPNQNALDWLASVQDHQVAISVITLRERLEGAERARRQGSESAEAIAAGVEALEAAFRDRILPINEGAARRWAKLLVPDGSKPDDKALAIAAENGLTFVTLNWEDVHDRGVPVLNPGRNPPKIYDS